MRFFIRLVVYRRRYTVDRLHHREAPEVLVKNIAPLESTAFEQRLQVDLRVRNPNDYDVQATGVDFRLDLNGKRFARGLGNRSSSFHA